MLYFWICEMLAWGVQDIKVGLPVMMSPAHFRFTLSPQEVLGPTLPRNACVTRSDLVTQSMYVYLCMLYVERCTHVYVTTYGYMYTYMYI